MAITKKWAANGIKTPIPNDPQGDNLVNYDEGFTTPYRTPIKDGGVPIGMGTFNQLMFDITDEVIENKKTLNQVAQQINGVIDDTQTSLTSTWSSQLIDTKLSTAVAGVIDDNQITSTLTWSSIKISAEIGQGGGGTANIDDNTISTDKVWSSFKTNEMVKGGRTISVSNWETKEASGDTTITNTTANAKMVNLSVKVKTNSTADKYLGDVVVYYNTPSREVLRQSCVSQNITNATELTTAMGMTILDAQDSLIIKSAPASGVQDFWNNVKLMENTSNITGSAPEPEPLGEGVIFTAQASSSSVTFNKQGTPTELQLEYQTTLGDVTSGWQDYTLGTRIDLNASDKVSFRNKGTQTITQTSANYHYFTMAGEIKAENDLTFLFDGVGGVDTIAEYGCYKMFSNCSALTEMPDLNATNIGSNGYANMFEGCTKLKTIKPLNATTITNYSYKEMFKNCSGLIISEGSGENQFLSMPAGAPRNAGDNMFVGTGGRFTGTPTANNSYFYNATIPATDILRFTAQASSSSITFNKQGTPTELQLEYRTNTNPTWQNYTLGTQINLANIDDWVEMRNRGLQTLNNTSNNYHQFVMTGKIAASGNIQYLLDKSGKSLSVYNFCYANLFSGCTNLTTAPSLPATTLANNCYSSMFNGCTSLTTAPSLPATTLANNCYNVMFSGCTKLTTAPSLPATTLAAICYGGMFMNCTSLTTAPSLPATTLAASCYGSMFYGCTSLTTAPSLPATTLADNCYNGMFKGCTSLTTAPSLPATTLVGYCYANMFSECTKLKVRQGGSGTKIFTCPSTSGLKFPVDKMFYRTGGSFTGGPTAGNTYYWYN